ncbi:alpha/beta fold hydrolase [Pseudoprimorskyibacter insulae]|uniref:AB hydrolase-1 domain-containing protein n=1 Tax=Pseudoprimorskyibacter insulae TaxID=1695997 RepID=A0A2R8AVW8_9RHOB|nr:alpha/beta hydrolase [Pseudoprimorskyibacter insulae]SPF80163.1 hypothetical protein PRI8871_01969 [Pseudoprimorskyibacter insulae]
MKTVYLHALPGGAHELSLTPLAHLKVANRNQRSFDALADAMPAGELHLVGFSMGTQAALRLADILGSRVVRVTLASPVVPPILGGVLPKFIGTGGLLGRLSSGLAAKAVAKPIVAAEPEFFADKDQHRALVASIQQGLTSNAPAMMRECAAFEKPWHGCLERIRCQVSIWQGEDDAFVAPETASALARHLPYAEVNWCRARGHYATLEQTMFALSKHPDLA